MSSQQANVKSVQALVEFRNALGQFRGEAQQTLDTIARQIRRFEEWLEERQRYWRQQVEYWQEEVYRAQRALEWCLQDEDADCYEYEHALSDARHALREVEEEFQNVQHWRKMVEQAVADYQKQAYRLAQQLQQDVPKAGVFLGRKIAQLDAYRAETPVSGGAMPTADVSLMITSPAQIVSTKVETVLNTPQPGTWQETGIHNIPVNQIINRIDGEKSHVKSQTDFHKVSYQDMVEGFRKLQRVVLPAVQQGATGDDFSQMDAEQGLTYEHGYRRIYDAFYGHDAIRLDKIGENQYDIVNGYHRLFVARELGLETVPAQVVERQNE